MNAVRYPGQMARLPSLRASDADREQVAERLRVASTEGRLGTDELEERLGALYRTRTYGELDVLVADLPATDSDDDQVHARLPVWALAAAGVALWLVIVNVLARVGRPFDGAVGMPPSRHERFERFTRMPGVDHSYASYTIVLLAIVAACALLGWLFMRSTRTTKA